jgi:hypothetical protein
VNRDTSRLLSTLFLYGVLSAILRYGMVKSIVDGRFNFSRPRRTGNSLKANLRIKGDVSAPRGQ